MIRAVLWDFGGVILSSPFESFNLYEAELGVPADTIRRINATNPDTNAWALYERSEIDRAGFCTRFDAEALAAGVELSGARVLDALYGEIRPAMVEALRRVVDAGYATACLTNNIVGAVRPELVPVMALFDVVVESSKVGLRKPEVAFYELACAQLGVEPADCVFLDDLGVNLKPARAMGMATIKVVDPDAALAELETLLELPLRSL